VSVDAPRRVRSVPPAALRALFALVVIALGLLLGGGGAAAPPTEAAARLVPDSALVFVHVSLDEEREPVRRAAETADDFASYKRLRDQVVSQLRAPGCDLAVRALRSAEHAALALLDAGDGAAGSLVLIDTGREQDDTGERDCGALRATHIGRFLALGQAETLKLARDLHAGRGGTSLAEGRLSAGALRALPTDRVVDGWVSAAGVRRLLAPQGGLLGLAGTLVDQPALRGAAFALSPAGPGARLTVRSILDADLQRRLGGSKPFRPTLASELPAGAMAYLGVGDLKPALRRLARTSGGLGDLVADLPDEVLRLFSGEAAVMLSPASPAPIMSIVARTDDENAARERLRKLPARMKRVFVGDVFDGKVALATSREGLRALRAGGPRLDETPRWNSVAKVDGDSRVSSVLFLDFSRLLTLAEQTGLDSSSAYRAVRDDLSKVGAIGARTSGSDRETTSEIVLLIT
jgi:hypothetical protein